MEMVRGHLMLSHMCPRDAAGNPRFATRSAADDEIQQEWGEAPFHYPVGKIEFPTPTGVHIRDALTFALPEFEWHTGHRLQQEADAANAALAAWKAAQNPGHLPAKRARVCQ